MPGLRRVVQTFVAAWCAGSAGKIFAEAVGLDGTTAGIPALIGLVLGVAIGWVAARNVEPWTPRDLRDGAIGYGIVGGLILVGITAALASLAGDAWIAPAAVSMAVLVVASAVYVHRHADELGVPSTDDTGLRA